MKKYPHLNFEQELWSKGSLVAGIDEVGRGCFAGPLVVGAIVLKPLPVLSDISREHLLSLGINDSKLVSKKNRELIIKLAQKYILFSSIQYISVNTINEIGVGEANKIGFQMAADDIEKKADPRKLVYLTDAFKIPDVPASNQKNIIRGDSTSITIALASIYAKVKRDLFMENLSLDHPLYGFDKHKGYGTKFHRIKLKEYGPTPQHRTQFIQNYI